ncbi:hypothetical protein BWI93_07990 [Siphonobacter sp. BAB-5385]|uniref:redoxin domain-containing protein n=1 Tax=Siphonobacter sp. BAB-5385 TaxID=1864822 RepID=UPI000B9EA425|nr:redoxin domain-containing protein [Siphonobacter sp. BAB-5385]OZI08654.1 hypothetical protein BWI93_07990 [Siphonobacter sp. BAB-5385]
MKLVLIVLGIFSGTLAFAQQPTNATLDSLKSEKDPVQLQSKLKKLESGSEADIFTLLNFYQSNPAKSDSLVELAVKRFPKGTIASNRAANRLYAEKDGPTQERMLAQMEKDFPGADLDMANYAVAYTYTQARNKPKVLAYLNKVKSPLFKPTAVHSVASTMATYDSKEAEQLITQELASLREVKTLTDTSARAVNHRKNTLNGLLSLYSEILAKNGDYEKAYTYLHEVYTSSERKSPALIKNYGLLLSKRGHYQQAFPLLEKTVTSGLADSTVRAELASIYKKLYPGKNEKEYLASLDQKLTSKYEAEAAKLMINEPAPSFIVTDASGKQVSLADFKGKTIVLDFWATWCGPCKASFPAMQMVVNKYRQDPQVKFLFIHTWERQGNPTAEAQEYLKANHYDLDLYMDIKNAKTKRNEAVSAFNVNGIPAKFVIDGKGRIRYKLTGFSGGNEAAVSELSAMINSAKANQ